MSSKIFSGRIEKGVGRDLSGVGNGTLLWIA